MKRITLEELKCLLKASGHRRNPHCVSRKDPKGSSLGLVMGEIGFDHIEVIEIGKQRARARLRFSPQSQGVAERAEGMVDHFRYL